MVSGPDAGNDSCVVVVHTINGAGNTCRCRFEPAHEAVPRSETTNGQAARYLVAAAAAHFFGVLLGIEASTRQSTPTVSSMRFNTRWRPAAIVGISFTL